MNNPLVSVIMPAFNAEMYIGEAINSVITQSFDNWELIVVDDGSIDGTADIVNRYRVLDNRIKYLYQERGYQGKARNKGILNASGIFIAFLDSDDIWLKNKLSEQVEEITRGQFDLVFSNCYVFENTDYANHSTTADALSGLLDGNKGLQLLIQANRIPILTVLARRDKILEAGAFTEKYELQSVEDYHLWLKMLINGCVFWGSSTTLAKYRKHGKSTSSNVLFSEDKIPVMFSDLLFSYPGKHNIFQNHIIYLYKTICVNKIHDLKEFNHAIDRYFHYRGYSFFGFPIKLIRSALGEKATRKLFALLN